jgi:hypothetical protein
MVATATAVSNRDPSDSGSDSRRVRRLRALAAQLPQQPRRPAAAALESEGAAGAATEMEDHVLVRLRGAHERSKDPKPGVDISGPGTDKRRKGYGLTTRDNTPLPALNSFGVSTVLPGFGVLPKKVTDFAQARDLLRRDGAVILSGLTTELGGMHAFRDTAESLPGRLFGDELLGDNSPGALVGIVDGASNLEGKDAEPVREFYRIGKTGARRLRPSRRGVRTARTPMAMRSATCTRRSFACCSPTRARTAGRTLWSTRRLSWTRWSTARQSCSAQPLCSAPCQ